MISANFSWFQTESERIGKKKRGQIGVSEERHHVAASPAALEPHPCFLVENILLTTLE